MPVKNISADGIVPPEAERTSQQYRPKGLQIRPSRNHQPAFLQSGEDGGKLRKRAMGQFSLNNEQAFGLSRPSRHKAPGNGHAGFR